MIGKDVDGGFAEYVKVPVSSIVKLPDKLPFEQAAIMGCAVPTAYHALKRGRVRSGDTVVVFGIGGLGAQAVQLAERVFKADLVVAVDVSDWKLKLARQLGANATVNASTHDVPEEISRITGGSFADVIIDFVGRKESITQAIASVGKGGRVVLVGISNDTVQISPYRTIIGREMEIIGVDDHLKSELVELMRFVRLRKINLTGSVTHRVTLEIINQGFQILEARREKALRVVVTNNA
jgi:propanol-preferring alcohol dehydrogenase